MERYFSFKKGKNMLWNQFEEDLASLDFDLLFEDFCTSDLLGNSSQHSLKTPFVSILEDMFRIRKEFNYWISDIDYSLFDKSKMLKLDKNALYFTFNYTLILQYMYEIENTRVLHIHDYMDIGEFEVIVGHGSKYVESPAKIDFDDIKYEYGKNVLEAEYYRWKQNVQSSLYKDTDEIINSVTQFWNDLMDIDTVFVLGHSVNRIDIPYYSKIIDSSKKDITWHVSYYSENEKDGMFENLVNIGIKSSMINLFKLEELVIG